MRGVTAGDYSFARDPAVGIYVDDVYHSTLVGANIDLADIERIEVKRGPQGTLAGNASIAGSISIYSKQPKGDDSGFFAASLRQLQRSEAARRIRHGDHGQSVHARVRPVPAQGRLRRSARLHLRDDAARHAGARCELPDRGQAAPSSATARWAHSAARTSARRKIALRYVASDRLEFSGTASATRRRTTRRRPSCCVDAHPAPNDGFNSVYSAQLFKPLRHRVRQPLPAAAGPPVLGYATFDRPLDGHRIRQLARASTRRTASFKADYDVTDKIHLKTIAAYSDNGGHLHQAGDVSPLGYVQGQVFFDTRPVHRRSARSPARPSGTSSTGPRACST